MSGQNLHEAVPGAAPESVSVHAAQLGGKIAPTPKKNPTRRRRPVSIKFMVGNAKGCLRAGAKEACKQLLEIASKGAPHFNELLVGNKLLLMHVMPSHILSLSSSPGFV